MKKLSEYKDEEALEVLADILEPTINIFGNEEIAKYFRGGVKLKAVQIALKKQKKDVLALMAALERVPVEEYHCNLLTLPRILLEIFNDPELESFFMQQSEEKNSETSSGSVMENTEDEGDISSNM